MCIICYSPAGFMPTEGQLNNCNASNPDGFGWAVRTPDKIITGRTMNPNTAIERYMELRSKWIDFDAVYHARITTHGPTMLENNHPFRVGDERTILAHNGMLPIEPAKGDRRSDTRIFAEDILTRRGVGTLDKPKEFKKFEKWMKGSKMVIMTSRDDMLQPTYILNEDDGLWDEGMWFSNTSYMPYVSRYPNGWSYMLSDEYYVRDSSDLDFGVECLNPECGIVWGESSESAVSGVCRTCWHCVDCGSDSLECLCHTPKGGSGNWWNTEDRLALKNSGW